MVTKTEKKLKTYAIISTVVGRGTKIKGSITIQKSGRIDGHVEGEVTSEQDVIVGEGGVIEGQVNSHSAIIGGKVLGTIHATSLVVLEEKADLRGDIHAAIIHIAEGAKFNGYCYMLKESERRKISES